MRRYWAKLIAIPSKSAVTDFLSICSDYLRSRCQQLQWLLDQYPWLLLIILFFTIWHPGFYRRESIPPSLKIGQPPTPIAPRSQLYPIEMVNIKITQAANWLVLYMGSKTVVACPIRLINIGIGQYEIVSFANVDSYTSIAHLCHRSSETAAVIGSSGLALQNQSVIEIDDDFWENIFPYLRIGTLVLVE